MKTKQGQGLGRLSLGAIMIMVLGDLFLDISAIIVSGFFIALFSWIPFIGGFIGGIASFFGVLTAYFITVFVIGLLVMLLEWANSKSIGEGFVDACMVMFIVAIPTPIAGVVVGILQYLTMTKVIKK